LIANKNTPMNTKNARQGKKAGKLLQLTSKFTRAFDYARVLHVQGRKETVVPYLAHLLGVASLVMGENGHVAFDVTEDIAIAALLHDAVEDTGGRPRLENIRAEFGEEVARIVEGCTDSFEEDSSCKEDWEPRKKKYLERLRSEPRDTLLVSAADKLYNARAVLDDYRVEGPKVWKRFKRGRDEQLWYFNELIAIFEKRGGAPRIVSELKRVVAELTQLSAHE
jgi:(p)ppGpp synthase/HD superfamily hydrolase